MFNREKIIRIEELNLNDGMERIDENESKEYFGCINEFIVVFPKKKLEIKEHFLKRDYPYFTEIMIEIREILRNIKADNLSGLCLNIINEVGKISDRDVQEHLNKFLSSLTTLSSDLEMAREEGFPKETDEEKVEDSKDEASEEKTEDENEEVAQCENQMLPDVKNDKKDILVVDDVLLMLEVLKNVIKEAGYHCTSFNSGHLALGYLAKHQPDLIILDIQMPYMDGYELAEKIRDSGQTAPIFFLTGNTKKEYVKRAIHAGVKEFILKPIDKAYVLEKIKKYIEE